MTPNYFLESNRLPLLRSVLGRTSDVPWTLGLPIFGGGLSGKRWATW
jgi:hypothetical protein